MKNKLTRLLKYDLPLHFVILLTNWLPDMVIILRLRGWLAKPFFGKCGKNLRLGRNVIFYNPQNIAIGNDVYVAYGNWFSAGEKIELDDEVMIGPYCVFASSNHTRKNGSFRYGKPEKSPVFVGKGCWIAAQCTILAGSKIECGSLLAANSVASGTLAKDMLFAGSPARKVRTL